MTQVADHVSATTLEGVGHHAAPAGPDGLAQALLDIDRTINPSPTRGEAQKGPLNPSPARVRLQSGPVNAGMISEENRRMLCLMDSPPWSRTRWTPTVRGASSSAAIRSGVPYSALASVAPGEPA